MHLKPSYLPHSDVAPDLVKSLTEERGLLLNKKNKIIPQHKYKWTIISCSHPINRAAVLIEKAHLTYSKFDQQMDFQGYYQLCVLTIKVFLYPIWIFAHPFPQKCPTHDLFHWPVSAYLWWQIKLSCTDNAGANWDRKQASGFREYLLS